MILGQLVDGSIRHGLAGKLIDFRAGVEVEARAYLEGLLDWTAPARAALGIDVDLPVVGGSERFRVAVEETGSLEGAYRAAVAETALTYGRAVASD